MFRWSAVFRQTRSSQMTTLPREIFPDVESERPCWSTFRHCYCPTINLTSLTQSFTDKCWQLHKRENVHSSHLTAVLKTVFPLTPLVWSKNYFAMIYWHTSYCYENTHKSSNPSVCGGRRTSFHFLGKCPATMHLRHSLFRVYFCNPATLLFFLWFAQTSKRFFWPVVHLIKSDYGPKIVRPKVR